MIIILVGLPGRGKSAVSKKIYNYFNWLGYNIKVFNAGNLRRNKGILPDNNLNENFFTSKYSNFRNSIAEECFQNLLDWIEIQPKKNRIAIFDATNTTLERRKRLIYLINNNNNNFKTLFIELCIDNKELIDKNILSKQESKDYNNYNIIELKNDFNNRIEYYKSIYNKIRIEDNVNFIRSTILENGKKYIETCMDDEIIFTSKYSVLFNQINYILNNTVINKPIIYLSRHGQSEYNIDKKLGGNSSLSELGQQYSIKFKEYIDKEIENNSIPNGKYHLFSSTLKRTKLTSELLNKNKYHAIKELDEISTGIFDDYTYKEIEDKYPEEFKKRQEDKFYYRYPMGESYQDIINRLRHIILKIESHNIPTVVVSHQATLRTVYAYFRKLEREKITNLEIPLHTVIKLIPDGNSYKEERIKLL